MIIPSEIIILGIFMPRLCRERWQRGPDNGR
jgi:hypothetical protein